MSTDKIRAEFEAWVMGAVTDMTLADFKRDGEIYEWDRLNMAFAAWQGSRAALEIELPPSEFFPDGENEWGYTQSAEAFRADAVRAAIESAGVKVKS